MYNDSVRKYKKEYDALYKKKHKLEDEGFDEAVPGNELDSLINQIFALIEGDYSRAIFDYYSVKKPLLIRNLTGETVQWLDAFGDSFEATTIGQRHSLVGLIEGDGRYRIK